MLASALAGITLVLAGWPTAVRVGAAVLSAGALASGWNVRHRSYRWRFVMLVVCALGLLGLSIRHVLLSEPPYAFRSLQVATFFAFGAVAGAAALRVVRITTSGRALLLSFSLVSAAFVADAFVGPAP